MTPNRSKEQDMFTSLALCSNTLGKTILQKYSNRFLGVKKGVNLVIT